MKVLLYLNSSNTDFEPFGDISDILIFRLAGDTVINHLISLLTSVGIKGTLLVSGSIKLNDKVDNALDSIKKEKNGMKVVNVPSSSLYALLQDEEQVLLVKDLIFPAKEDLESLLMKGKEEKLPAVLVQDKGSDDDAGIFLLDPRSIPAAIECVTGNNSNDVINKLEEHLKVVGLALDKLITSSPMLKMEFKWNLLDLQETLMEKTSDKPNIINGVVETGAILKGGGIVVKEGALIRSGSYITGPAIIGENAVTGPNCYIRPYTFISREAVIGNAVEIKNSIIGEGTHVGHLSYIGDSITGKKCNFGAGTKVANLKFNDKEVLVSTRTSKRVNTGRRKLGIIMGDYCKTGINASLMPGVVLGTESVVGAACLLQNDLESHYRIYLDKEMKIVLKKLDKN
ncbi:MAG: hypothetical protein ACTSP4_13115 [Candidatus Hodarchaeales archaeon]